MAFIDLIICGSYLLFVIWLGFFSKNHVHTIVDYLVAGRKVTPYLGVASLGGTELGLITVMYNAQKGFSTGLSSLHMPIIAGVVTLIIGLTGFIVVPLRRLKVLTIPEFYEFKFDKSTRVLGAIILVLAGVLNMGLFLKVAAVFVAVIFGLSPTGIPLIIIMALLLVLVLFYTLMGGMVSVVVTDFVQFILLSVSLSLFAIILFNGIGWDQLIHVWESKHGVAGFNPFNTTSGFGISYVLWMLVTAGLVSIAIWPTALSRALIMPSDNAVKKQYLLASVPMMARFVLPIMIGAMAVVVLGEVDALTAFPAVALRVLPVGLLGVLVAGLLAAMMSTFDGYLLCWSGVIVRDIIMPISKSSWSDRKQLKWIRFFIVISACFMFYWGLFYNGGDDIWDYLAITGAIYFTGAIPIMIGGLYWKFASSTGAKASLISGLTALFGLEPVRNTLNIPFDASTIGLTSVIFASVCFVAGSILFPKKRVLQ